MDSRKSRTFKKVGNVYLVKYIGEGTFSKVYEGRLINESSEDGSIEKMVAVKVIENKPNIQHEIMKEINILRKMNHPNIVNFIEHYVTKANTYIVMEFCERGSFRDLLNSSSYSASLSEPNVKNYFYQMCLGVQELASNGFVHRDIKLDNIFITKDFQIKIGDFGFAKGFGAGELLSSYKGEFIYRRIGREKHLARGISNPEDIDFALEIVLPHLIFHIFSIRKIQHD